MRELIIGCEGFIGSRLMSLTGGDGATHGNPIYHDRHQIDLSNPPSELPEADIVYICAGINGAKSCEGNNTAWRVNVDGTIDIALRYAKRGAFVVWISSRSVEWATTAYSRQKAYTESVLRVTDGIAIVRAGRVVPSNLDDLCSTMMRVGRNRVSGLSVWGSDDIAYVKDFAKFSKVA